MHLHLDLIIDDAVVQIGEVLLWQVSPIIDAPIVLQKVLYSRHILVSEGTPSLPSRHREL